MDNEIESLSKTLINIYQKNLIFLQESFPEIYKEIDNFSKKLENQEIQEKYSLEYVDGYFDILNHENNGMYYFTNSYEDADKRREFVDFSQSSSLDLLRKIPGSNKLMFSELYQDVMPIIQFINDSVDMDNVKFEKIYKFIFIGTGLGIHIQEIDKKLKPYTTLIIEPELEIFRLSLFITDYSVFDEGNRTLFLSIGANKRERNSIIAQFAHHHEYMNYNVKHYSIDKSHEYIKDEIVNYFGGIDPVGFPYRMIIQNLDRTMKFLRDKEKFISVNLLQKHRILQDKNVLIISAGPSLDNYIDWITEHQDKFLIICVDVIVRKLEKHNIVPEIVVSIDPSELCADYLTTENPDFLNNSAIIFKSQQAPEVLDAVKGKNYYFLQTLYIIQELGFLGSTPNVGTFALKIAGFLGAENIYIIGNDAAFNQETGTRYANDSSYTLIDSTNEEKNSNVFSIEDVVIVKGNLKEKVKTNNQLLSFRKDFENEIITLRKILDLKIFNMSNGVYMEGMTPITLDEMNKVLKIIPEDSTDIIKLVEKISKVIEDIDYCESINLFDEIIKEVEIYQKKEFETKQEFLSTKLDLMAWIIKEMNNEQNGIFATIFLKYIALVDIYVNFILNLQQENLSQKDFINKVSNMWAKGTIVVFENMKQAIEE